MSVLLDEAIEQLRELPEEDQNEAAEALFAYIANDERRFRLKQQQADEVRQIRRNLQSGSTRLANDQEVAAARANRR